MYAWKTNTFIVHYPMHIFSSCNCILRMFLKALTFQYKKLIMRKVIINFNWCNAISYAHTSNIEMNKTTLICVSNDILTVMHLTFEDA